MAHSDTRAPRLARIYLSMAQMLVEFRSEHVLTFFAGKSTCFFVFAGKSPCKYVVGDRLKHRSSKLEDLRNNNKKGVLTFSIYQNVSVFQRKITCVRVYRFASVVIHIVCEKIRQ